VDLSDTTLASTTMGDILEIAGLSDMENNVKN
jgi:hypothetical protein